MTSHCKDGGGELLRRVAMAGPGFRGKRENTSSAEREALAKKLRATGRAVPDFFHADVEWIDRRAKLFEAGDYPDKGISVSSEQIAEIAANFELPVPVWIEHAESPLELGYLTDVQAVDGELFGTVALTKEADALVERSEARSLSVGLTGDLKRIREVSLVRNPRVASARLFSNEVALVGQLEDSSEPWRIRYRSLERQIAFQDAGRKVAGYIADGRITPAEAEFARALLASGETIEFGDDKRSVAELVIAMFERRVPHGLFKELAPSSGPVAGSTLLPEERDFYKRHFPDVDLATIEGLKSGS